MNSTRLTLTPNQKTLTTILVTGCTFAIPVIGPWWALCAACAFVGAALLEAWEATQRAPQPARKLPEPVEPPRYSGADCPFRCIKGGRWQWKPGTPKAGKFASPAAVQAWFRANTR